MDSGRREPAGNQAARRLMSSLIMSLSNSMRLLPFSRRAEARLFALSVGVALLAAGCASPNRIARHAPRVPYQELGTSTSGKHVETMSQPPYVIEIKQGEEIPVRLALDSRLLTLDAPTMRLHAKKDIWILIRKRGAPLISEDGKNFRERSKNSFAAGLGVTKERGPSVDVKIRYRADISGNE